MWTGFYVGLNASGTWGEQQYATVSSWPLYNPAGYHIDILLRAALSGSRVFSGNGNGGFIGGGQIGYNWQIGGLGGSALGSGFVVGVEADIQGVAAGGGG